MTTRLSHSFALGVVLIKDIGMLLVVYLGARLAIGHERLARSL